MLRRSIIVLLTIFVLASLGASWTAVLLLHNASEARAEQAERAEARTEAVRQDVEELLAEMRDPADDTRRSELWRTAERIERLVEDLHVLIEEPHP